MVGLNRTAVNAHAPPGLGFALALRTSDDDEYRYTTMKLKRSMGVKTPPPRMVVDNTVTGASVL